MMNVKSENVLKDVDKIEDDSLLFPGNTITVSVAMVLVWVLASGFPY